MKSDLDRPFYEVSLPHRMKQTRFSLVWRKLLTPRVRLGHLRAMPDRDLRALPGIGPGMFKQIRTETQKRQEEGRSSS